MEEKQINPEYKVVLSSGKFGIEGTEKTTGEKVLINGISEDEKKVSKFAEMLNKYKVSVHHAEDVIFDKINEFLFR
ncbi:MAG: hypothetical protein IKU42_02330 [Oscillospiraceae bacterium]|nr:hypothetical protein [Oscillospiraceae bacterium]